MAREGRPSSPPVPVDSPRPPGKWGPDSERPAGSRARATVATVGTGLPQAGLRPWSLSPQCNSCALVLLSSQ